MAGHSTAGCSGTEQNSWFLSNDKLSRSWESKAAPNHHTTTVFDSQYGGLFLKCCWFHTTDAHFTGWLWLFFPLWLKSSFETYLYLLWLSLSWLSQAFRYDKVKALWVRSSIQACQGFMFVSKMSTFSSFSFSCCGLTLQQSNVGLMHGLSYRMLKLTYRCHFLFLNKIFLFIAHYLWRVLLMRWIDLTG